MAYEQTLKNLPFWIQSLLAKASLIKGFEGALSWQDYARLDEDERDVLMVFLAAKKKTPSKQ